MKKRHKGKTCQVVAVGDILVDNLCWVNKIPISGGDEMITKSSRQSGGSAANTCVILNVMDIRCAFCGIIGNDEVGNQIISALKGIGADLRCLQQINGRTGYTVTMVEPCGERTMLSFRDSSAGALKLTEDISDAVREAQILYLSGYLLSQPVQVEFVFQLAQIARENGTIVMLDTSPIIGSIDRDVIIKMLSLTDVLMPNQQEMLEVAQALSEEEAVHRLLESVPSLVVKKGSTGSRIITRSDFDFYGLHPEARGIDCSAAAVPVKPLDTTGAGDSYNAGFIASFLTTDDPEKWLSNGNSVAAQVITREMSRSLII